LVICHWSFVKGSFATLFGQDVSVGAGFTTIFLVAPKCD